jgi:hypothetical protein
MDTDGAPGPQLQSPHNGPTSEHNEPDRRLVRPVQYQDAQDVSKYAETWTWCTILSVGRSGTRGGR